MFSPFLDHFTDFYTFLSRFSPKQTGNSAIGINIKLGTGLILPSILDHKNSLVIGALEAMWRLVIRFLTSMLQSYYGTAFVLKVVFAYTIFIMNKPYIT